MALTVYVSPRGDDRWSGRLPDPNSDGSDGPVATLAKARDLIRDLHRQGNLPHGSTVQLRGGSYFLPKPVRFGPEDSAPVLYTNYPGETPVLHSGVRVTNLRHDEVNGVKCLSADVSEILRRSPGYPHTLFVNEHRASRPTVPPEGSDPFQIEDVPDNTPKSELFDGTNRFQAAKGQVSQFRNLTDVHALVNHFWVEERMPLTGYDPETRIVTSSRRSVFRLTGSWEPAWATYRLENVFEALRRPGQWYLDRDARRVYYVPLPGQTADSVELVLPVATQLIVVEGAADGSRFVHDLRFEGLTLRHTDWEQPRGWVAPHNRKDVPEGALLGSDGQAALSCVGVIHLSNARNITVENCTIEKVGGYAIAAEGECRSLRIVGNHLHDLGAGGVKIHGNGADTHPDTWSSHHRVTDNHIHHIGEVFKAAIGIITTHAHSSVIDHNHIHHTHYTAISVGWVWGYKPSVTRDVSIAYNHLHHIGRGVLSDMGAIYTLGVQPGTTIHHNLIHDVVTLHYGGWGIYPDEGTAHVVIENNVVYDTQEAALHCHYGRENIVRNNVFVGRSHSVVALSRYAPHSAFTLTNNILATTGSAPIYQDGYKGTLASPAFHADHNLLWDLKTAAAPLGGRVSDRHKHDRYTLDELRAAGLDRHSVIADPTFVSTSKHPYEVAPDSPAVALGFKPIDLSTVGPRLPDCREVVGR